jgi:Tfp pilus assembly protein PilZ
MVEKQSPERRRARRITPANPVTVAIENGRGPVSYGVVADISERGACVWTDGSFGVGDEVVVQLRFSQEPVAVPATGSVVWRGGSSKGTVRYGLQWTHTGPQHARLGRLIETASV